MSNEKREQQMMDAADSYPNWISVEEELPKEQGKYMFRLSNGDMCYETYYPKLKLLNNVTHWMESPTGWRLDGDCATEKGGNDESDVH